MADAQDTMGEDPFVTAGELALGLLEDAELAAARRAQLADRSFAAAVDWWNDRLGTMAEANEAFSPSETVWRGIEARLDNLGDPADDPAQLVQPPARPANWSIMTALAGGAMAAVALALFVARPAGVDQLPPPVVEARGPQLVAQLQDEESGRRLASVIDTENRRLALNISGLTAETGQAPELWVIPEGGAPVSLGYIPQAGEFGRDLSREEAGLLVEGAALAVTFEENTGERHEAPSPPILLAGALDQV